MKIVEVKKLSPLDRFLYWMRERHAIYLRRRMGKPKPWTDDEVLQSFFFTNPYRENDKVTVWFKENIREPLRDDADVLFATVAFRWFNLPEPTGRILMSPLCSTSRSRTLTPLGRLKLSLLCNWDPQAAMDVLGKIREEKGQIFTGAFMVNSPPGQGKLEAIIERVTNVWKERRNLLNEILRPNGSHIRGDGTMERAHALLTRFPGMGGFMAYEVVCDLRYTALLEGAPDKMTWCNVGPGARRGLYRILGIDFKKGNNSSSPPPLPNEMEEMRKLLHIANAKLRGMPPLELREIEHSLCEADKYSRALEGDGKMKRKYNGL